MMDMSGTTLLVHEVRLMTSDDLRLPQMTSDDLGVLLSAATEYA